MVVSLPADPLLPAERLVRLILLRSYQGWWHWGGAGYKGARWKRTALCYGFDPQLLVVDLSPLIPLPW